MPADSSDKPSRTVQFDTGMAMTLSCSPSRDPDASPSKRQSDAAAAPPQRGTAK